MALTRWRDNIGPATVVIGTRLDLIGNIDAVLHVQSIVRGEARILGLVVGVVNGLVVLVMGIVQQLWRTDRRTAASVVACRGHHVMS